MKDKRHYFRYTYMTLVFICMAQIFTVNAASQPSLSASANVASVTKGDPVNISINLNGNPTISTFGVALEYDSSMLSYKGVSWNSGFSGSDMKMASDTGSEVNLSVVCEDSYSADGTVATVKFQAVSDASSIPVTLSLRDMADGDLEEVTDCKVSGKVRVPQVSGDTTDKEDGTEEPKIEDTASADAADEPSASNTDGTSNTDNVSNTTGVSETITVHAQKETGSILQSTPVQNAQAAPAPGTGSAKPDQSYKTGAGIGNDIFLVIAVACGILALALLVLRRREEEK